MRTPLRRSAFLSDAADADVRLKLETQQPSGSFKIRGAFNAALRLAETAGAERPHLVTASAGNHGRALASAAQLAGLPLTVYVPQRAPRAKVDAIRATGAMLRACIDYDAAERTAKERSAAGDGLFVSPYSNPDVIAGAGTVGLEILEDWPDVDTIVVPIGGGGLISGIALVVSAAFRKPAIVGVEVEASSPFTRGLAAGRIIRIDVGPTLADGLSGNLDPDTVTFDIVRDHVDRIVTVDEAQLRAAIATAHAQEQLIVEGAGAVGIAALLAGKLERHRKRIAIVVSGGNIDPEILATCLERP